MWNSRVTCSLEERNRRECYLNTLFVACGSWSINYQLTHDKTIERQQNDSLSGFPMSNNLRISQITIFACKSTNNPGKMLEKKWKELKNAKDFQKLMILAWIKRLRQTKFLYESSKKKKKKICACSLLIRNRSKAWEGMFKPCDGIDLRSFKQNCA